MHTQQPQRGIALLSRDSSREHRLRNMLQSQPENRSFIRVSASIFTRRIWYLPDTKIFFPLPTNHALHEQERHVKSCTTRSCVAMCYSSFISSPTEMCGFPSSQTSQNVLRQTRIRAWIVEYNYDSDLVSWWYR
jgi:hypothetical protein